MLCSNPWDHQNLKKIKASYQTRPFKKVGTLDFMESIGPAEVTNGGGMPSAQPQTTPKPVSVDQVHLGQSLCVLWCRQAVHQVVCVVFRSWIRTSSALASH